MLTCSLEWAIGALAVSAAPGEAPANPPPLPKTVVHRPYLQVSPGVAAVFVAEHRFSSDARWAWPWSLGAGALFMRGPHFRATIGGALEHRIIFVEGAKPHGLHALAESRIGAGSARVWGYGLAGLGLATTLVDWPAYPVEDFYGVVMQLGAGVRGLIGERTFLGGEVDIDLDYYISANKRVEHLDDFHYHTLTFEIYIGRLY